MGTGSGLDAQMMFGAEGTWATAVTPDHAVEFDSETLKYAPTYNEPTGLRVGRVFKRGSRLLVARKSVTGDVVMEHATKGMGLIWKQALGSAVTTPTQIASTTAYKQIHTYGGLFGLGMTWQVGRPEPASGLVKPATYSGCKIVGWEFSVKDNAVPTLKVTLDGQLENTATALATPSYLAGSSVFSFSQATLKLGGTASTASGETTITGGVAVATVVKDFTITAATPADVARYGVGNAGLKSQQLQNNNPTIMPKMNAEFGKAELYDLFSANTPFPAELDFTGSAIGVSGSNFLLSFIMPQVRFKDAPPNVSGPGVVQMAGSLEVYDDEVNPPIQVKIVSDETVL